jgi:hypothetical protein
MLLLSALIGANAVMIVRNFRSMRATNKLLAELELLVLAEMPAPVFVDPFQPPQETDSKG